MRVYSGRECSAIELTPSVPPLYSGGSHLALCQDEPWPSTVALKPALCTCLWATLLLNHNGHFFFKKKDEHKQLPVARLVPASLVVVSSRNKSVKPNLVEGDVTSQRSKEPATLRSVQRASLIQGCGRKCTRGCCACLQSSPKPTLESLHSSALSTHGGKVKPDSAVKKTECAGH